MIEKEALEYVVGLAAPTVQTIDGQEFSDKQLYLIREAVAKPLAVNSLQAIIDYIKADFDMEHSFMIHIKSHLEVDVLDSFNSNYERHHFVAAKAFLPKIQFDNFIPLEQFNIMLQSCFVQTEQRDQLLKIVGNVREENVKQIGDDGISQAVTAKTGIATVEEVKLPNPVQLKPYRTFVDVWQQESSFVFRMKDGGYAALFEADGGAWKLAAMSAIKFHLESRLKEEIERGQVVIIG